MHLDMSHSLARFARDAVRSAALLAREIQRELNPSAMTKPDRTPVTVADFAVQALIGSLLDRAYPGATLVAEEDAAALRAPDARPVLDAVADFVGRYADHAAPENVCEWIDRGASDPSEAFWVLDPIDGTKGFVRGGQYAVALAYIVAGQVQIGALGCPNLSTEADPDRPGRGAVLQAVRGVGAWVFPLETQPETKTRLRVSRCATPQNARVLRSVESSHTNVDRFGALLDELGVTASPVCMDSQAKYAVLAAGRGDLLFRLLPERQPDYRECIWDQAAGALIVEEAGGAITDLRGAALDFSAGRRLARNYGVLASNGRLHDPALAALKRLSLT